MEAVPIVVKHKNSRYRIANAAEISLRKIKVLTIQKILGHNPSNDELARFVLCMNGTELDESKTASDLNLANCVIECIEREEKCIHIYDNINKEISKVKFKKSISISEILSRVFGDMASDFYLTEKESSIVLKNDITTSTDVVCMI